MLLIRPYVVYFGGVFILRLYSKLYLKACACVKSKVVKLVSFLSIFVYTIDRITSVDSVGSCYVSYMTKEFRLYLM